MRIRADRKGVVKFVLTDGRKKYLRVHWFAKKASFDLKARVSQGNTR